MKICTKCKAEKDESEFGKMMSHGRDYAIPVCLECRAEEARDKRERFPGRQKIASQKWQGKNKEHLATYWRQLKYGLSKVQYDGMLEEQNNCCGVCGDEFSKVEKNRKPHVDHDHSLGKVRGLLCHTCNVGIGCFKDSSIRLQKAISYLENLS